MFGRMLQTQTNEAFLYLGEACLLILVGVYELHRQIPLLLHRFAKQNLRHKYKEENLFFLGQIGRRIHSAGRTMAVVAILLTISLATMFVGLTMGQATKPILATTVTTLLYHNNHYSSYTETLIALLVSTK